MNFEEYQTEAFKFAVYEDKVYPYLALAEEAGEFAEKIEQRVSLMFTDHSNDVFEGLGDEILKELGDMVWQLNAICCENGFSLSEVFSGLEKGSAYEIHGITVVVGNLLGVVAKMRRGDKGPLQNRLFGYCKEVAREIVAEISYRKGGTKSIHEVMQQNLDKLTDRAARNKIKGDGDNR